MPKVVLSQVMWEAMFEIVDDEGFVLEKQRGNGVIHPFTEENCKALFASVVDTKEGLQDRVDEAEDEEEKPAPRPAKNGRDKARRLRPPVETPSAA